MGRFVERVIFFFLIWIKIVHKSWFEFLKFLKRCGFSQSKGDHTLLFKYSSYNIVIIFFGYADNIIVTSDNCEESKDM